MKKPFLSKNNFGIKYFTYLILVNFLFPTFDGYDHLFGFSGGTVIFRLLIMVMIIVALVIIKFKIPVYNKEHYHILIFISILFAVFFFLVNWSLVNNIANIIFRDVFELHRPFYYFMLMVYPLIFVWDEKIIIRNVFKTIIFIIIIQIITGILHSQNYSWFSNLIIIYTKFSNSISHRATGTFGNPYDYGVFMIFSLILSAYYAIKNKFNILFCLLALFCFNAVLISQSKTAFYVVFPAIMYALLFCVIHSRKKFINLMLIIVLLSSVLTLSYIYKDNLLRYFTQNLTYLASTDTLELEKLYNKSLENRNRLDDLLWVIKELSESNVMQIMFGVQIGKSVNDDIEFGYAVFLYRYGLIGLAIYISFFLIAIVYSSLAYIKAKRRKCIEVESLFFAFHVWSVSLLIATVANNFIDQPRHTFFFFTMVGLSISYHLKVHRFNRSRNT
jgi:hypothetical protein